MKKLILLAWLGILSVAIAAIFWHNEYIYQLPTPVPQNYRTVLQGSAITLPASLTTRKNKPLFLHFFNPDCPCSRFNIPHFIELKKQFENNVDFMVVVMNNDQYSAEKIQKKLGVNIQVSFDTSLAALCGVYSTPQAVLLDKDHQLYYRGNYNKSRYCTDKKTNYAQTALESLVQNGGTLPPPDKYALTAYGCQLPQCTKN